MIATRRGFLAALFAAPVLRRVLPPDTSAPSFDYLISSSGGSYAQRFHGSEAAVLSYGVALTAAERRAAVRALERAAPPMIWIEGGR